MIEATLQYHAEKEEQPICVIGKFERLPLRGDVISYNAAGQNLNGVVMDIKHIINNPTQVAKPRIYLDIVKAF